MQRFKLLKNFSKDEELKSTRCCFNYLEHLYVELHSHALTFFYIYDC